MRASGGALSVPAGVESRPGEPPAGSFETRRPEREGRVRMSKAGAARRVLQAYPLAFLRFCLVL